MLNDKNGLHLTLALQMLLDVGARWIVDGFAYCQPAGDMGLHDDENDYRYCAPAERCASL